MDRTAEGIRLVYRQFRPSDRDLLWAWAQIPQLIQWMPSMPRPLTWATHAVWWNTVLTGQFRTRVDRMIDLPDGRTIGRVHAAVMDADTPEVGVFIAAWDLWRQGIGRTAISYVCDLLKASGRESCCALIHQENSASIKAFMSQGFVNTGVKGRGGQFIYRRAL